VAQIPNTVSVFTKPWKMPLPELAALVRRLGFEAIELPVRPGYQVPPENVAKGLPLATRELANLGVKIAGIAGPTDEATIAACGEAGIPIIRVMIRIGEDGYLATEARAQREFDTLVPFLEKHRVTIGVQNHCGRYVCNAMGLRHLVGKFDPRHVGAIWDVAHCGLQGEQPEDALDILWAHLCLVNFKSAFWQRVNGSEAEEAKWQSFWTTGRHGLGSWSRAAAALKKRHYAGPICLPAEYTDEAVVERLVAEDLAYVRALFS
jgi:sugar phosphate isomerase/epimerase